VYLMEGEVVCGKALVLVVLCSFCSLPPFSRTILMVGFSFGALRYQSRKALFVWKYLV
jgi:hypothetical protein